MKSKVESRRSAIHGNGVFAIAPIKKGEEIIEYTGKLITHKKADALYSTEVETGHTFLFILNDKWVIDGNVDGNVGRWINTGCVPNAEAFVHADENGDKRKDRVVIEALHDIQAGEEIIYDYGIKLETGPDSAEIEAWACRCGAPNCKGTMLKWKGEEAVPTAEEHLAA